MYIDFNNIEDYVLLKMQKGNHSELSNGRGSEE